MKHTRPVFTTSLYCVLFWGSIPVVPAIAEDANALPPKPYIEKVERVRDHANEAGLGDEIKVTIDNVTPETLKRSSDKKWILFLNGIPLSGIYPDNVESTRVVEGKQKGMLTFRLRREGPDPGTREDSISAWKALLSGWYWYRPASVALGTSKAEVDHSIEPLEEGFYLVVVPKDVRLILSVLIAVVVLLTIWRSKKELLRETPEVPLDEKRHAPYSLAKVQWAWWIVVILSSYLAIGLVTWDYYNVLSVTALGLLGISSGTALGAKLVNSGRTSPLQAVRNEHTALLEKQVAIPPTDMWQIAQVTKEIEQTKERYEKLEKQLKQGSRGFFTDILSDTDGISLHRFQIVVWTVILGMVFAIGVWNEKSMPEFNANLLALMGISSGGYLAFKVNEVRG